MTAPKQPAQDAVPQLTADRRPPVTRPRRALWRWINDHFNDIIVVIIAMVTVLASVTAFLQSWANSHYASDIRQSQSLAIEAVGYDMRSHQRENYDFTLYTAWNEWDWRRARSVGRDEAMLERAISISALVSPLTPLLDENEPYYDVDSRESDLYSYHADLNLYTTTLFLEQRAFSIDIANTWNGKADGYVTVLTLLAVSLFLYGLSTTIKGNLRFLFAGVGTFLVVLSLLWTAALTVAPVPEIPFAAIASYAEGEKRAYSGDADGALQAYDTAIDRYPSYGSAYEARAGIYLDQAEYARAAEDYRAAIAAGRDDAGTYWNLGWTYYLLGDYPASLEASRRALDQNPDLLPVIMNVGTAMLADGDTDAALEEYERGLRLAVDPAAAIPASWSRLYLRETVSDLTRLINALNGQTGFYQVPELGSISDHAAVRDAAENARRRIKGGLVAIEATGSPRLKPVAATISPLTFALGLGWDGTMLGQGDTFPRGILSVVAALSYSDMPVGATLSRRVTRLDWDGVLEYLPTMGEDISWSGPADGTLAYEMRSPWPGSRGLLPGIYTVEFYVNGHLLQEGTFTIPDTEELIVGPLMFAAESASNGAPSGPCGIFPAGIEQVKGLFKYSGLADGTVVVGRWYRNGYLYQEDSSVRSSWGSESFALDDVPAGDYLLELSIEGDDTVVQWAEFRVVDVETYLQAIGGAIEDPLFHRSLGDAYTYRGDYAQASAHYQQAIELDPDCAECYYQWWSALYDQGEYGQAAEQLRQAVELRPQEYSYRTDLGETYLKMGDEQRALDAFRQAVPAAPTYTYNAWGNALYAEERYEESIVKYQQAIELNPDNAVYYANLGGSYSELGQDAEATAALEQAVTLDPSYAWAWNKWGNILYAQDKYAEAVEKYQQAALAAPWNATYHANLGATYNLLDQYDLAIPSLERAIELDPGYAWAWNRLGNAFYGQGRYAEAAEAYRQAVDLMPRVAVYHYNLGLAYYQLQEDAAAIAEFEQAVDLAASIGDEDLRQDAEEMLERLR